MRVLQGLFLLALGCHSSYAFPSPLPIVEVPNGALTAAEFNQQCPAHMVYQPRVPDEHLPDSFLARFVNRTAVEKMLELNVSMECATHLVNNTFESTYYAQFEGRPEAEIYQSYVDSYGPAERGRGLLNELGLDGFAQLGDFHLIHRFAEYVAMSYCDSTRFLNPMAKLNLRVGEFTVDEAMYDSRPKLLYYVATNTKQNITALVLRGTDTLVDLLLDVDTEPIPIDLEVLPVPGLEEGSLARVHKGFWKRYVRRREEIATMVKRTMARYGNQTQLVVVGHSLGGAWAMLEAADLVLNQQLPLAALYTYGSPLVGNVEFVDPLAEAIGVDKIVRVVNGNDMIPRVGFHPRGSHGTRVREHFIYACPPYFDVKLCPDGDPTCSHHYTCLDLTWRQHSAIGKWRMDQEFCNLTTVTPNSVYDWTGFQF